VSDRRRGRGRGPEEPGGEPGGGSVKPEADRGPREPQARLFVGARVSVAVAGELGGTAESLARRAQQAGLGVRWVAPATYHVTLKFLGWTRRDAVAAIGDAVVRAVAGEPPLAFGAARLGAFPSPGRATVVWAGVEDDGGGLGRLAAGLEREMEAIGYRRERRAFHPHVTLGRLREPADVAQVLLPFREQVFSKTHLDEVTLYENVTKTNGSEYEILLRAPLGRPENGPKRQTADVEPTAFDASDDGWDRDPERRS
jgi:RNA 2',3'-cyclic 3'-phosphodiesterase